MSNDSNCSGEEALVGDLLINCAYSLHPEGEIGTCRPKVVLVDDRNRPRT